MECGERVETACHLIAAPGPFTLKERSQCRPKHRSDMQVTSLIPYPSRFCNSLNQCRLVRVSSVCKVLVRFNGDRIKNLTC